MAYTVVDPSNYIDNIQGASTIAGMENVVFYHLIKTQENLFAERGSTVTVPIAPIPSTNDMTEGNTVTFQNPSETLKTITINHWKEASILLTDIDRLQSNYDLQVEYGQAIGFALMNQFDIDTASLYTGATTTNASTGGYAIVAADFRTATKALNTLKIPRDKANWHAVLDEQGEMDILAIDAFTRYDALGTPGRIEEGTVGRAYGFNMWMSQNIQSTGTPELAYNMLFHKNAIAASFSKNITIESARLPEYKANMISGDIIYGVDIIFPDYIAVISRNIS